MQANSLHDSRVRQILTAALPGSRISADALGLPASALFEFATLRFTGATASHGAFVWSGGSHLWAIAELHDAPPHFTEDFHAMRHDTRYHAGRPSHEPTLGGPLLLCASIWSTHVNAFLAGDLVPCMVEVMPQRNYTQRLGAKGHDKKVLSYAAVCDSASDLEHLNDAELNPIRVRIALRTASLVGGEELMELRLHSLVPLAQLAPAKSCRTEWHRKHWGHISRYGTGCFGASLAHAGGSRGAPPVLRAHLQREIAADARRRAAEKARGAVAPQQRIDAIAQPVSAPAAQPAAAPWPPPGAVAVPTAINCPFAQKNAAKALGAKWDFNASIVGPQHWGPKSWYVPAGVPLGPFARWLR